MRILIFILSVLVISSAVVAAPNIHKGGNPLKKEDGAVPKAIHFMNNDEAENSIVALNVGEDGMLSEGSRREQLHARRPRCPLLSICRHRSRQLDGCSQSGSNTMALFSIPSKPLSPAKTKSPAWAIGTQAGIACFSMHHHQGLKPLPKSPIVFPLSQSTPLVGPFSTVSHVFFNQDETMLFITVKNDPMKNTTSFLSMLPVQKNGIDTQGIRSSPPGTQIHFGSTIIPDSNNILATGAAFGATTISTPVIVPKTTIENQSAASWAAVSPMTKTAFVTDVGRNNLVEVDPTSGEVLQNTPLMSENPGNVDLLDGGKFVYALSPGRA